jgi:hypothetical protein
VFDTLHGFAEVQHAIITGKWMDGKARALALVHGAVMMMALEGAQFLVKPLTERFTDPITSALKGVDGGKTFKRLEADQKALWELERKFSAATEEAKPALLEEVLWKEAKLLQDQLQLFKDALTPKKFAEVSALYERLMTGMDIQAAQSGLPIGADAPYREAGPVILDYDPGRKTAFEDYYKSKGGTFEKAGFKDSPDIYVGALPNGERTFSYKRDTLPPWKRVALQVIGQTSCFVAGTPLLTPTEDKPNEQFKESDEILSRSKHEPERPTEAKVIEVKYVHRAAVLTLVVGGRNIRPIAVHSFQVRDRGWQCAREIVPGQELTCDDGQRMSWARRLRQEKRRWSTTCGSGSITHTS